MFKRWCPLLADVSDACILAHHFNITAFKPSDFSLHLKRQTQSKKKKKRQVSGRNSGVHTRSLEIFKSRGMPLCFSSSFYEINNPGMKSYDDVSSTPHCACILDFQILSCDSWCKNMSRNPLKI